MDYRPLPAIFVADAPGLDFLNSVATPVDESVDWIADGEGFLAWLAQAQMVPREALTALRQQYTSAEFDAVASNSDPSNRSKNRRIEISLVPNIEELISIPELKGDTPPAAKQ